MKGKKARSLSEKELRFLLHELDQPDVEPLSDAEVKEIESAYEQVTLSPERDARQRKHLESLRQSWLAEVPPIQGIISRADEVGKGREQLASEINIGLDILLKLDLRLIKNVPGFFLRTLASALEVDVQSVYRYLAEPPKGLSQIAATSKGKPADSAVETWTEAIQASSMADDIKAFWQESNEE